MADNVNNNNGDIVNSRYPPKEYTAVPGQLLMPHLKKMKQAISDSKDFDPNFDVVAANKWLRDRGVGLSHPHRCLVPAHTKTL